MVANTEGVHARAATLVSRLVRRFQAKVELSKGYERVVATEVLQVLSLGAGQGDQLLVEASGPDADAVLDALGRLFEHQFSEEIARELGLQAGESQEFEPDDPPAL
jgi:phosphotransferase system HPr (HPr) family protein